MAKYNKISIVIPVHNEVKTIKSIVDQVILAATAFIPKEIIIIDDFSNDGTSDVLAQIQNPAIKILRNTENRGKGASLIEGFRAATGDILVIQDADSEYDPNEIQVVLKPFLEKDASVVYGSRYLTYSSHQKFLHTNFNKLFSRIANLLLGTKLTDIMTCYKAFTRPALLSVLDKLESKRFGFEPEVTARLAKAKYKIVEVPVSYSPRNKEQGKHMNLSGQFGALWALLKYSLLTT